MPDDLDAEPEGSAQPMVLRAEQAVIVNEWMATTRIRISKRIVTEIQTVEVQVRREELVITEEPLSADEATVFPAGHAPAAAEELRFTLLAEVPAVTLDVLPIEQVTIGKTVVQTSRELTVDLQAERLELEQLDGIPGGDQAGAEPQTIPGPTSSFNS